MPEYTNDNIEPMVRGFTWPDDFDLELEVDVQTDKDRVKVVPCRECKRPMVVTTFFAPAKALCRSCAGDTEGATATVGVPIPGQTDPAKAVNLADACINVPFRTPPLCPFNGEHTVELKAVSYAPHHGPRRILGYDAKGVPKVDQEVGESVMYQCTECNTTIGLSTAHQGQYRRQNEPKIRSNARNSWEYVLGYRAAEEQPKLEARDLQHLTRLDVIAILKDAKDDTNAVAHMLNRLGIDAAELDS